MKIAFINDSCQRPGIQYISSILKASGHDTGLFLDPLLFDDEFITVKTLSRIFDYKKRIVRELKVYRPDLIGISVVTGFYQWACTMARMIKEEMDVPIIFGGIHPTSVPERVIKNDFVDMVCVGEGEYPMLELVNSMEKGQIDYSIKNIWFKRNGNIIRNDIRLLVENLDELPFPDYGMYYDKSPHFRKGYYIMTSRGCPYSCSYCCHSYLHELYKGKGKYLRQRSVKNVIEELVKIKNKYQIKRIMFSDDCFGNNINWLKEFSYEYRDKVGIEFSCEMSPNDISSESLEYLKSAGCREIEIGIQSWNEKIREVILNRRISNSAMENAMRLIKQKKIDLITGDLLGFPGQDDESILKSAELYSEIKPERSYIFILKYYPNTLITKKCVESGFIKKEDHEKILEGFYGKFLTKDGNMTDKKVIQFLFLFFLVRVCPKDIIRIIIKKRIYGYFPIFFTPALLSIFNNFTSATIESRFNRITTLYRYSFFMIIKYLNINWLDIRNKGLAKPI